MQWISWHQPTEDYRPLQYPPTLEVKGWWCTGHASDGSATLVAAVDATTEEEARLHIVANWPEATNWRFCEQRDNLIFGDRFPVSDWMVERGCSNASALSKGG